MRAIATILVAFVGVFGLVPRVIAAGALPRSIMQIQGASHTSPFLGDSVITTGVVTLRAGDGFYLQDPTGDGDDATSDAIFVFTGASPGVSAGDDVRVDGPVNEFLPGGDATNLTVTEIRRPRVVVLGGGRALPAPVAIGPAGRSPPATVIDDDALGRYEPALDGLDFYESLEGMQVRVARPRVVNKTNPFGELWVVADGTAQLSLRGALAVAPSDLNPERIQIDDALLAQPMPAFNSGEMIADVEGILSYRFGNYELLVPEAPVRRSVPTSREIDTLARDADRIRIATFNVHNLGPDDAEHVEQVARIIVSHLGAPEIVGLEEIEDGSGPEDDGTVDGTATLQRLAASISLADGPRYDFVEIPPRDGADGGAPGGNIRVALLFDPARVALVRRGEPVGSAETRVEQVDGAPRLSRSPGRVAPAHPAWIQSRKPLAAEFRVGGRPLFVVVAHFISRSRSTPLFGAVQPARDPDGERRALQAGVVAGFVADILAVDREARVVVLGDLNDDWFSAPLSILASAPLRSPIDTLAPGERYTLFFDGNAHAFDHVLVSESLAGGVRHDIVHVAAEFADGASDHDPVAVSVRVATPEAPPALVLSEPRPNPFSSRAELDYRVVRPARVRIDVFDVRGTGVRSFHAATASAAGTWRWDGTDDTGRRVPAGVYLIRVSDGAVERTKKAVLIR